MPNCRCTASTQKFIYLELCILQGQKFSNNFCNLQEHQEKSEIIHHTIILTYIHTIF